MTEAQSHLVTVAAYPDHLLEALIADLGSRNLRNLKDHEVRFLADRSKAARAERRKRQDAGKYTISPTRKQTTAA